jgi:[glutamine synthetase] adenylyltransferase / [glutamine synthetase]-adenylyl-L-tyrosine phosphorylase
MLKEFSAIQFQDAAKARENLASLEKQLSPRLMVPLASLLAHSPDPDGALNLLERFAQAAGNDGLADLARHPTALTYLVAIFGHSKFLAEAFLADPGLPVQFARDRNFTKLKSKEDLMQDFARLATTSPDHWLSAQLALFKRRSYLRIVLKDVLRLSTLGESTQELSALADVILTNALIYCDQELEKRYGQPQYRDAAGRIVRSGFSIISLGKLGGNELNYSSDIDLLFLYSHDGETAGGSEPDSVIANKEYFVRLAHAVTRTITQATHHGLVFRVDVRLRPEGDQGDLAISLKSALEYYEHRARDWELQMLIKARHSAGDLRLVRGFLHGVETYIYGAPTDFAAIESVLWARETISKQLRESRDDSIDVKRHAGGIRDIEFLTQCLQRLHGGYDPWVRSGGTLFALRKLNDKGWLSDRDYATLTSSYEFLRRTEHQIQLDMGHQSHRLPADRAALDRLARRVGIQTAASVHPGDVLLRELHQAFGHVSDIYERVIHPPAAAAQGGAFYLQSAPSLSGDLSFASFDSTRGFLEAQAPELAALVRETPLGARARKDVTRLIATLLESSEKFALVREHPGRLRRALEVISASEYLADLIVHHPEDLAALDANLAGPPEGSAQMEMGIELPAGLPPLAWSGESGIETREKMALLRQHYRTGVLELGAADLTATGCDFAALGRWSALALRCISTAVAIATQSLDEALPGGAHDPGEMGFAILGLGRLGLCEFDLASDADLVFVTAPGASREDVSQWIRLAAEIIDVLSSYTRDGIVLSVDTRLRPRGQEGELVSTQDALLNYLGESAHAWEALTYLKAVPVAGNMELAREIVSLVTAQVLERFGSYPQLEAELREMRRRLEREVMVPPSNTKTAPGGYYDVDFAVSCLRLRNRVALPPGSNQARQIAALRAAGVLKPEDADILTRGAEFLRSVDHAIRLVTGRAAAGLPEHVGHADAVARLTRRWGLTSEGETLAARLRQTQQGVRQVYRRLLGAK